MKKILMVLSTILIFFTGVNVARAEEQSCLYLMTFDTDAYKETDDYGNEIHYSSYAFIGIKWDGTKYVFYDTSDIEEIEGLDYYPDVRMNGVSGTQTYLMSDGSYGKVYLLPGNSTSLGAGDSVEANININENVGVCPKLYYTYDNKTNNSSRTLIFKNKAATDYYELELLLEEYETDSGDGGTGTGDGGQEPVIECSYPVAFEVEFETLSSTLVFEFKKPSDDWLLNVNYVNQYGTELTTGWNKLYQSSKDIKIYLDDDVVYTQADWNVVLPANEYNKIFSNVGENGCPVNIHFNADVNGLKVIKIQSVEDKDSDLVEKYEFITLIGDFINPLKVYKPNVDLWKHSISINGVEKTLDKVQASNGVCTEKVCITDPKKYYDQATQAIVDYCKQDFTGSKFQSVVVDDCASFIKLMNSFDLGEDVSELTEGCEFVTDRLRERLELYLDIIKIAGPILAIVLGMLDFAKTIVAGDADKESKEAWRKFKIRLIAAALLFIVPVILGMILNVFLGHDEDYNADNPYCDLVDFDK